MAVANRTLTPAPAYERAFADARGRLPGARLPAVGTWRQANFARFVAQGIPTPRVEAWKYTNVGRLAGASLPLAAKHHVRLDDIAPHILGGPRARRLIFVNGQVVPELSHVESLPAGVRACSLARMLEAEPSGPPRCWRRSRTPNGRSRRSTPPSPAAGAGSRSPRA